MFVGFAGNELDQLLKQQRLGESQKILEKLEQARKIESGPESRRTGAKQRRIALGDLNLPGDLEFMRYIVGLVART